MLGQRWGGGVEQALLVARPAAGLLRSFRGSGRVLSAHARALNLSLDGHFLAVVAPELGASPWALLAAAPPAGYAARFGPGDAVACDGEALRAGNWALRWAGAPLWEPVPARPAAAGDRRAALAALDAALAQRGGALAGGFWAQALQERTAALATAVGAGDAAAAAAAATRLIGLGPGSTPAGDDLLAGCTAALTLLAAWGLLPPDRAAVAGALSKACRSAAPATTAIAGAELGAAAAGALVAPAGEVIAALAAGDAAAVSRSAAVLLLLGHTSGADLAQGIRLAAGSLAV